MYTSHESASRNKISCPPLLINGHRVAFQYDADQILMARSKKARLFTCHKRFYRMRDGKLQKREVKAQTNYALIAYDFNCLFRPWKPLQHQLQFSSRLHKSDKKVSSFISGKEFIIQKIHTLSKLSRVLQHLCTKGCFLPIYMI
ncbi:hypothetical protein SAY86_019633 [Trapa natans]|uniref:Uncharacterized protein n=1 Tax=Trapa natans TaxID=22666 RepID=A0AAN7R144_TRANT|nr:hypothetical protein SAY86_019633 [Trapa natans]